MSDVTVTVLKGRTTPESRKLKVDWAVTRMPFNELKVFNSNGNGYNYSVGIENFSINGVRKMHKWCADTFSPTAYRVSGLYNNEIHFAVEKHRTLLIMKWS
jgi:hypothetical protein